MVVWVIYGEAQNDIEWIKS